MLKKTLLVGLFLLVCSIFTVAEESDVISLTQKTFHEVVDPEKLILVEFFAPWCGHCKALAPEYEKAATELKEIDVKLAKIDCTAETELCNSFEVKGYPTLKLFRNGTPTDYTGGRKADLIINYMKKQAQPSLTDVTVETFDDFRDSADVVIVGFFTEDSQEEYNAFQAVADRSRDTDFMFGATGQSEAAAKAKVKAPTVVLYKKFDEGNATLNVPFTEEILENFIKTNSVPLLAEIGPDNYGSYVDTGLPLAFLFYENEEQKSTLGDEIKHVALEFKGKVNFVYIDSTKYGAHAANINLKESWPAFGIQKPEEGSKFPFDQTKTINRASIQEFVDKFVKGEISPSIKSEPIPEKNDEPVYVLVADSFEETVYDENKDVLIEFYAPWCGHCKKLAPTYEKLGETYRNVRDKILVAKMDATANDLPSRVPFKVTGFPTIKLFKAGDKSLIENIIDYQGDRSLESLIEFLDNHATNKVDLNITSSSTSESEPEATPTTTSATTSISEGPHEDL